MQLQEVRRRHQPEAKGQALTPARQANLVSRLKELRQAGMGPEDVLRAAEWVFTSANIRAERARETGDPLETLLRASKCMTYCELAEQEARQAPAVRSPMQSGSPSTDPAPAAQMTRLQRLAARFDDPVPEPTQPRPHLALVGG
jgi:hypothetical protein